MSFVELKGAHPCERGVGGSELYEEGKDLS